MLHKTTLNANTLELLNFLMSKTYLQNFVLVGGTSLALQIGHRISVDLDMFANLPFDTSLLKSELEDDFPSFRVELERTNTLITSINGVQVDFIRFKYGFNYPFLIQESIRLADIRDIAAMKLDAIAGRGMKKDFYDLHFLLKIFSLPELLDFYQQKYQHTTIFHLIKSLTYFLEAENNPQPLIFDKKITWAKVKKSIISEVQKL